MRESFESDKIYERVEKLQKEKGWSSYMLAKNACISVNALYRWRNKRSSPSLYLLENIAEALGVSLQCLLFDVEKIDFVTEEQKFLLEKWDRLNDRQKAAVTSLLESYQE